jgi:hypothetical protein
MPIRTFSRFKGPNDTYDFTFDWSPWLTTGDIITASTWAVDSGLTQPYASSFTDTETHIWLTGGTEGTSYRVTNHVTTQDNRQMEATWIIAVQEDF